MIKHVVVKAAPHLLFLHVRADTRISVEPIVQPGTPCVSPPPPLHYKDEKRYHPRCHPSSGELRGTGGKIRPIPPTHTLNPFTIMNKPPHPLSFFYSWERWTTWWRWWKATTPGLRAQSSTSTARRSSCTRGRTRRTVASSRSGPGAPCWREG